MTRPNRIRHPADNAALRHHSKPEVTNIMSNEITTHERDGYDGGPTQERAIQGQITKFGDPWTVNSEPYSGGPLIAHDVKRFVQRWANQKPIFTEEIPPGNADPDLDALNNAVPKSEWERGLDGNPKPPFQLQHAVYLLSPHDGSAYTSINSTIGQRIAVEHLIASVNRMRKWRGNRAVPIVELGSALMKTGFGMKQRPDFKITGWTVLGGQQEQLRGSTREASLKALPTVAPLTTAEIVEDAIPF
jgi:hypothetical protein